MSDSLTLADAASLADLGRYAHRAKALDDEAAIRLQAAGTVLAAWVGVLPGSGILGEGLVLGLRTFALAEPADADADIDIDIAVPATAVTDRTAHSVGQSVLSLPPVHLTPTWASLTPPRSGWEYAGAASGDDLAAVARSGLEEVGAAVRERGAAAGFTKQQVWGATVSYSSADGTVDLPAGVALAAYALGFLSPGQPVQVYRTNRWTRVTGPGGHVLSR
ncbi:MAG: hypothetical protein ABR500_04645 [Dermatophilaceae bacterium]|nr:hypothetical protein [Intrasporangiaceae bacterium]